MVSKHPFSKELQNRAERGLHGYPVAVVSYFGPDDRVATKVVVAILPDATFKPSERISWVSQGNDVRNDEAVNEQVLKFIQTHAAMTVIRDGRILGCPHEEGVGVPADFTCPTCVFWANQQRLRTGNVLQ